MSIKHNPNGSCGKTTEYIFFFLLCDREEYGQIVERDSKRKVP